jgi:ribosomal protein S2
LANIQLSIKKLKYLETSCSGLLELPKKEGALLLKQYQKLINTWVE